LPQWSYLNARYFFAYPLMWCILVANSDCHLSPQMRISKAKTTRSADNILLPLS